MDNNSAVFYSFCLYILYVLLPLVPAILTFKLFPDTAVIITGPLQGLKVNATGAFAAYVVTVVLGFFLVNYVEQQIVSSRQYAVQGVIANLGENEGFNSNEFYSRYNVAADSSGHFQVRDYSFVLLLDHPVLKPETVCVNYWGNSGPSGAGAPPAPKSVPIVLVPTPAPQRFRIASQNGRVTIVPETATESHNGRVVSLEGVHPCE